MNKMILGMLACLAFLQVNAAEAGWMTDLPKAQARAKAEKKLVLLDFTGSDWCPPCKALYKNVFSTPEFQQYAQKNLVLVEVDFPRSKKQPEPLQKANQALQTKFGIKGYPTIIVLDGEGKELSKSVGYRSQRPNEFIAELEALKKKSP